MLIFLFERLFKKYTDKKKEREKETKKERKKERKRQRKKDTCEFPTGKRSFEMPHKKDKFEERGRRRIIPRYFVKVKNKNIISKLENTCQALLTFLAF